MLPIPPAGPERPLDDQAPLTDLDLIRLAMLREDAPPPAEVLFGDEGRGGTVVLARLRFFRWVLAALYDGSVWCWEASLERRDQRLHRLLAIDCATPRGEPAPSSPVPPSALPSAHWAGDDTQDG